MMGHPSHQMGVAFTFPLWYWSIPAAIPSKILRWLAIFYLLIQKVAERTSALKKLKFKKTTDADLWKKVIVPDLISSEESEMDEDEEVLKVRSLSWRASRVTAMFERLDGEVSKSKTPQSKRQRKRRVNSGESSQRQQPADLNLPNWVFC